MARQTNTAITYDDANYMVTNEGFSRIGNIISGKKAMTKANIDAYLNTDDSLYSSYASNRLVPYQLLQPVAVCCPPIMTQIVEDGLYLDLYWTFDSNCSSVSAVAVTESSDGVNWSSWTTSDPAAPRRVINSNVTTYYKSRSWCGGVQSGDSNIVVYNPPAAPQEPLNIYTVAISEYQASTAIESDAATPVDQSVQIEVSLTAISGTGASVQLGGAIYAPLTTVGQTATVYATVKPSETYFISYTLNGEGATATVKSRVISASIDAIPSPDFVSYSLETEAAGPEFEVLNQGLSAYRSGTLVLDGFLLVRAKANFSVDGLHILLLDINNYSHLYTIPAGNAFDYTKATLVNKNSSSGTQGSQGGFLHPDGTSYFSCESGSFNGVVEWKFASAYNNTTVTRGDTKAFESGYSVPYGICFSNDGTRFIVADSDNRFIYEYTLTTAWKITTASRTAILDTGMTDLCRDISYVNKGFGIIAQAQLGGGGSDTKLIQWDLGTAHDASTAYNRREAVVLPVAGYFGIYHPYGTGDLILNQQASLVSYTYTSN